MHMWIFFLFSILIHSVLSKKSLCSAQLKSQTCTYWTLPFKFTLLYYIFNWFKTLCVFMIVLYHFKSFLFKIPACMLFRNNSYIATLCYLISIVCTCSTCVYCCFWLLGWKNDNVFASKLCREVGSYFTVNIILFVFSNLLSSWLCCTQDDTRSGDTKMSTKHKIKYDYLVLLVAA